MPNRAMSAVAPAYLFACIVLGGSVQGIWTNAVLQLVGFAIIFFSATSSSRGFPEAGRPLLLLSIGALIVVALQEVPLPSLFWSQGVRGRIVDSYALLGRRAPALPISLTPYETLTTLFSFIPPLAIFCALARLDAYRRDWLAAALLAATTLGILFGALQVVSAGSGPRWYLYPYTNVGLAVGFFADSNHMATLLVVAIPFIAAIAASARSRNIQRYSATLTILAGMLALIVLGIALNGSIAGYALAVPVSVSSAMLVLQRSSRLRPWLVAAIAASVVAAIGAIAASSMGTAKLGGGATTSVQSRVDILRTTGRAIADTMPLGSGLGSFQKVYRLYETPDSVTSVWVIHAHNDYVEIALELGLAGVILTVLFLIWWTNRVWAVWHRGEGGAFARAASIATAAILIHSLVEFPLRTAAISACFAMCLALLADRKTPARQEVADLRPARHIVIR